MNEKLSDKKERIINQALPLLKSGMSVLQISKEITEVSNTTLTRYLKSHIKTKPRMTDEEKQKILDLHDEGYDTVEIEEITGRNNSTIGSFLRSNNRKLRNMKSKLKKKDINEIIRLYNEENTSTVNIADVFNSTERTIAKVLADNNVKLRNSGTIPSIINNNYFESIDIEEKAYFLGLIIADGGIIKNYTRSNRTLQLSLELHEKDAYMVEKLSYALCGKVMNCRSDGRGCYSFRGSSKQICDDLAKYGVVLNKSNITYLPTIDESLMPHLIRGIFDGDGTVYFFKKNPSNLRFGFYGTHLICEQIKSYLIDNMNISDNKVIDQKKWNVSFINFGEKNDIKNFYDLIYNDATIYLTRKKEKFDLHFESMLIPR